MSVGGDGFHVTVRTEGFRELRFVMPCADGMRVHALRLRALERVKRLMTDGFTTSEHVRDDDGCVLLPEDCVSDVVDNGDIVVISLEAEKSRSERARIDSPLTARARAPRG